jgi:hypothetical protein
MTLEFLSPSLADEGAIDETLLRPRAVTIRPLMQTPAQLADEGLVEASLDKGFQSLQHAGSMSELRS